MDASRDRILDAALRLLEEGGSPSMNAIAAAAGVSRATLYRRFPGSEALRAAIAEERDRADLLTVPPRARLLAAARQQLNAGGLDAMSIKSLAQQCRVGFSTVYDLFGDKDGLVVAMVSVLPVSVLLEAAPRRQAPLQDWLVWVCAAIIQVVREDSGLYRQLLGPGPSLGAARRTALSRIAPARAAIRDGLAAAVRERALVGTPEVLEVRLLGMAAAAAWSGMEPERVAQGFIAAHAPSAGDNVVSGGAL